MVVTLSSDSSLIKETGNELNNINYNVFNITKKVDLTNNICANIEGEPFKIGSKYICELGDNDTKAFYVLETKGDNVSLIMNANLGVDGKALITQYPENTGKSGWCDDQSLCKTNGIWDNTKGPITANENLSKRIVNWTRLNQNQVSLPSYEQIYVAAGNKSTNLPMWLSDYRYENSSGHYVHDVLGYWTSSQYKENLNDLYGLTKERAAWAAVTIWYSNMANLYVSYNQEVGIRPVITILKSQLG